MAQMNRNVNLEGDVDINVPINIEEKEEDTSGGSS